MSPAIVMKNVALPARPAAVLAVALAALACAPGVTAAAESAAPPAAATSDGAAWWPVPVVFRKPAFSDAGSLNRFDYVPSRQARERWHLCVSVPRADFQYVAAVIHGIASEATRQGAEISVLDNGGADSASQAAQIATCLPGSDALLVVAAESGGLDEVFRRAARAGKPVINVAIETRSGPVTAKVVPNDVLVGEALGRYLAERYPAGTDRGEVAWFPGPEGASFTQGYDDGFRFGLRDSEAEVVAGGFTALDHVALRGAAEDALGSHDKLAAFAAAGLMIEEALDLVEGDTPILLSTSITAGIANAIADGRVAAAVNTRPVTMGRIAADIAIRAIEGRPFLRDVQPRISLVDKANVDEIERGD